MAATRRRNQSKLERDVIAVLRRHEASAATEELDRAERDRVIRDALEAGITQDRVAELAREYGQPLSQGRISQIKRGISGHEAPLDGEGAGRAGLKPRSSKAQ